MNILVFLLDAFKVVCAFAIFIGFCIGANHIGYAITGQKTTTTYPERTNHAKAQRVGVLFIVVVLAGAIFWSLTGAPFAR